MEEKEERRREEIGPDLYILLRDILLNWWVILLGATGCALLAAVFVSTGYKPVYSTSATFVVTTKSSTTDNVWFRSAEMAKTMQKILKSNSMRRMLRQELGEEAANAKISAQTVGDTNLLTLTVTADSSRDAMNVIRVVMENYTKVSYFAMGDFLMEVLEEPYVPTGPDYLLNVKEPAQKAFWIMAAALTGIIALLSYFHDSIRQEGDIERKLDAKSLGVIPFEKKYKTLREAVRHKKKALLVNAPTTGLYFGESYRKLAARVAYGAAQKKVKTIVVTSVAENEGKSTVAANLAIALAERSGKVILLEGDFRRPAQFLIFSGQCREGEELGEYFKGSREWKELLQKSHTKNLYLLPEHNCHDSSAEIVQSKKMKELIGECEKEADYVIIDSPPAGPVGDAEALAKSAGAVILVVRQNFRTAEEINDTLDALRAQGAAVLGVVLNGARAFPDSIAADTYGRYGYYGRYARNDRDRKEQEE